MEYSYLYDDKGYINFDRIKRLKLPFNFLISPRGAGKTYTVLKNLLQNHNYMFFSRRTQEQQDMVCGKRIISPFEPINEDCVMNVAFTKSLKNVYEIHHMIKNKEGEDIPAPGPEIGMGAALYSISKLRGFSARKVTHWVLDEFIPEPHERCFKGEGDAFLNAYETMNRNRELEGREPIYTYMLGNANNIEAGMIKEYGLMNELERMIKKKIPEYINRERGIGIWLFYESPIANRKKESVLYRFAEGTRFAKMSLDNQFYNYSENLTNVKNIVEYTPIACIGNLCMYLHKSKEEVYITPHIAGSPKRFDDDARGREAFIREYDRLWYLYLQKKVICSDVETLSRFINLYSTKKLE